MSDLAPADWIWEDHPEVGLADPCANGDCESCQGTFKDYESGDHNICGHPCPMKPKLAPDGGCRCEQGYSNCYGGEFGPCGMCACPKCASYKEAGGKE